MVSITENELARNDVYLRELKILLHFSSRSTFCLVSIAVHHINKNIVGGIVPVIFGGKIKELVLPGEEKEADVVFKQLYPAFLFLIDKS